MTILQAIFLGIVQGFTEFLPVSSSGHLVIFQTLLGLKESMLFFDVMVHLGTLLAVFVFFRKDIIGLLAAVVGRDVRGEDAWSGQPGEGRRFVLWVIVATLPAVVVGLLFKDQIEEAFSSLRLVGFTLPVTGLMLLAADRARKGDRTAASLGWVGALAVGAAQAFAIIPAISRSGATICMAIFLGIERRESARFSFMLAIPAILGAAVLEFKDVLDKGIGDAALPAAVGAVVAFVIGLVALKWLINTLNRGRLLGFSIYCIAVGIAAIAISFLVK
jgi:undecaprenyl-diphosphatase